MQGLIFMAFLTLPSRAYLSNNIKAVQSGLCALLGRRLGRGRGGQRGQRGQLFFVSWRTIGRLLEGYWKVLKKREVEYY